ncbi:MAG: SDR family oxidoreductase [Proteobacteria bacterium]|nr:SDR family oxidoreductase [Pseudomonadota bacterium]
MTSRTPERVIVTGATSGIGHAIAVHLAARATVIGVMGRRRQAAEAVAEEVQAAGATPQVLLADVASAQEVEAAVARFVADHGGIDTVVSCAGIAYAQPVAEVSIEDWWHLISTNLSGTFYLAKFTLPALLRSQGTFTAISSDAGTQGAVGYGPYCASKHGVNGLIKCMALEYGPRGVRCNAVCPGYVETPMADRLFTGMSAAELDYYRRSVPLGRFARAEEVAAVVAHLTSREAAYTNGMLYALDGGSTAGYFSSVP